MAWFSGWRKRSIAKISLDELRREKIRLEHEQTRLIKKVEELEHQKKLLFQEGASKNSQREQLMLSRRITELDVQGKNYDNNLRRLSRQTQAIDKLIQAKVYQRNSIITRMDTDILRQEMEKIAVEIVMDADKTDELISALEDAEGLIEGGREDPRNLKIMELMNELGQAQQENPGEAFEKTYQKVDQTLRDKPEEEAV